MTLGRSEDSPRPFAFFSDEQKMALLAATESGIDFDLIRGIALPLRPYIPQSVARALAERGERRRVSMIYCPRCTGMIARLLDGEACPYCRLVL